MPSRKLARPSSYQRDRRPDFGNQSTFTDVYEDIPATDLPPGAVAKAINAHCRGNAMDARLGSILWTTTRAPSLGQPCAPRTGYNLTKTGRNVRSNSGDIFEIDDVSNYIIWDNGLSDEITDYIGPQNVRVRDTESNTGTACYLQGKLNLWEWHNSQERWVIQLGPDFWLVNLEMTQYTQVVVISADLPSNGISTFQEFEEFALVKNSSGLFKIIFDEDPPIAYQLNTAIQNRRIEDDAEGEDQHKYHYVSAVSRLSRGTNFRNRETKPLGTVEILTESGTNQIDDDRRDWAEVNTDEPIGDEADRYGILDGGDLGVRANPVTWVESNGTFFANINELGWQQIICDFSTASAGTMNDIARVIQDALRVHYPSATCEYIAGLGIQRFRITSGRVPGGRVRFIQGGTTGINIAGVMQMEDGAGTLGNPPIDTPHVITNLQLPFVPNRATEERAWHWNFYNIYRCGDLGPRGLDDNQRPTRINVSGKQVVNSPDLLIWNKDLRVAASFYARKIDGLIEAQHGEFELADVGSVIEWDNGDRDEIIEYINSSRVRYARDYYYYDDTDWMAAWIGNGRGARVSQIGNTVYRTHGTLFTADDRRRPIWWPDGSQSIIRCFINENTFTVWDSTNRNTTGMTLAPTMRNYNDSLSDEKLFARASAWTLKNRFMTPIARGNMMTLQPGFVITGVRGNDFLDFCQLEAGYRQFLGYHVQENQRLKLEDQILSLWGFPQRYSALCQSSTYTGVTNNAQILTIPDTQQIISAPTGLDKIANIGISNFGSISKIDDDWIRLTTNTLERRDFNGLNFGPDLTTNEETGQSKWANALRAAYPNFTAMFVRLIGDILWWRDR